MLQASLRFRVDEELRFFADHMSETKSKSETAKIEEKLQLIAVRTAYVVGAEFFRELSKALSEILGVSTVFVAECVDSPPTQVRTLSIYKNSDYADNFCYSLEGTPCEEVLSRGCSFYPNRVQEHFPNDQDLVDLNAESYGGIALHDSKQNVVGHLVLIDRQSMTKEFWELPTLKTIRARCGAEIERLRIAETQQRMEDNLRLASLGTIAAGIAHEINNPLTAIQLNAEIALQDPEVNPTSSDVFKLILNSVNEAAQIVGEVLRSSNDDVTLRRRVNVVDVVRKAIDQTRQEAASTGVQISLSCRDCFVDANSLELRQVFVNLISNAIQASNQDGRGTIKVSVGKNEDGCQVSVRDFGQGLTAEDAERVFEPFFTTRRNRGGTGLGLSVSREIVLRHNGQLEIEVVDHGAVFVVKLPLARVRENENCRPG